MLQGDSGGPLIAHQEVIGIASITRCICTSKYNVYTNVNYYRSWIKKIMTS